MSRVLPLRMRIKMAHRRRQRANTVKKILGQYFETCPWCKRYRPRQIPNVISVKIPNSHSMCKECLEKAMAEIDSLKSEKKKEQ